MKGWNNIFAQEYSDIQYIKTCKKFNQSKLISTLTQLISRGSDWAWARVVANQIDHLHIQPRYIQSIALRLGRIVRYYLKVGVGRCYEGCESKSDQARAASAALSIQSQRLPGSKKQYQESAWQTQNTETFIDYYMYTLDLPFTYHIHRQRPIHFCERTSN